MSRNQQVKEPLYILLQQKREEALLMLSSLSDGAYVVDSARGPAMPVFPDRKKIFSGLLLAAIAVPVGFVSLVNIFRTRIRFEKDIVDRTDIPVLGVIPRAARARRSPTGTGLVSSAGRDPLTESFRILRSKFQYLNIDKKKPGALILQITSSGPREGKSFVSVNMALSLAWLGKKVLLVGADLRKPAIGRYLRLPPATVGLSNYLSGTVKDVHWIISRHEGTPAFDIIRTGAIPFNPGELLGGPLLGEMLEALRAEYDYIIVDSAPFLVVSDSFTISKSVDSVLYVVRSGYTRLNIVDRLQNMMREGSLPSVMIVLNGVDFRKNRLYGGGRRGAGYGYGYGYGYGWGHGARYGYVSKK
jgi:capsular exopolysaccharide synthesis family protein